MNETQIFSHLAWLNSVNRHFIIWLTFEKFKKFVLTWTGHDRLACMGKPKKIFYKKNFPLFCCVRTRNSQFVEKHVLVSHFCALLSLIFCNKSEQCFSFFATKPYKQAHYAWFACCRPAHVNLSALHMSAFTMVFYGIMRAEPVIWWNTSFAPFHSQDLIVNSPFWPPHIISL